jgi:hypothetical protein
MEQAIDKSEAHELLDKLDAGQLSAVVHLLQVMTDPLKSFLESAPMEDEEITPETAAAIERSRTSFARGEAVAHDEIVREFGEGE